MHGFIKNKIKLFISLVGRHRWPTNSPQLVILAYHRILPCSDPRFSLEQPTMLVTPETFEKNLAWTENYFDFISLKSWLSKCRNRTLENKKYCAITFDDGWIDNLEYALPILKKFSAPATIFCVSEKLNDQTNYWPGHLTRLVLEASSYSNAGEYIDKVEFAWLKHACGNDVIHWCSPKAEDYNKIIESVKIYKDADIISFINKTKSKLNFDYISDRELLNVSELKRMISTGLIDIGSHTSNHIRFSDETPDNILHTEIIDSRTRLETVLGVDVNTFCYPNGYHPKSSVELARKHYLGSCTLTKGWNSCNSDYAILRRISFHEEVARDVSHFQARLSGWI